MVAQAHRADEHRQHTRFGKALRRDEGVHSQGHLNENRTEGIDVHILHAVCDGVFAGAEGHQKIPVPDQQRRRQEDRDDELNHKTVAQCFFRRLMVALAHENGGARRPAVGGERGKCRDNHDKRHAYPDAGQRRFPDFGDMADIHPVHNIVQHVDKLRGYGGKGQLPKQSPYRFLPQKILILTHSTMPLSAAIFVFSAIRSLNRANCRFSSSVNPRKICSRKPSRTRSIACVIGRVSGVRDR